MYRLAPHIRLVNRQIKDEAEKQCAKLVLLSVVDTKQNEFARDLEDLTSNNALACVTDLEYTAVVYRHRHLSSNYSNDFERIAVQMRGHREWLLVNIDCLTQLKEIHLELRISWLEGFESTWSGIVEHSDIRKAVGILAEFPSLKSIVLRRVDDRADVEQHRIDGPSWYWNRDNGWKCIEAVKGTQSGEDDRSHDRSADSGEDGCDDATEKDHEAADD